MSGKNKSSKTKIKTKKRKRNSSSSIDLNKENTCNDSSLTTNIPENLEVTYEKSNHSSTKVKNDSNENITLNIEEISKSAWKIFNLQDKLLRHDLHIEYLDKYLEEDIIPKGLTIFKKPAIKSSSSFMEKWNKVLHNASKDLMKLLIQEHKNQAEENIKELVEATNELNKVCPEEETNEFLDNIDERMDERADIMRKNKETKLIHDRKLTNSKREITLQEKAVIEKRKSVKPIMIEHIDKKLNEIRNEKQNGKKKSKNSKNKRSAKNNHKTDNIQHEDMNKNGLVKVKSKSSLIRWSRKSKIKQTQ